MSVTAVGDTIFELSSLNLECAFPKTFIFAIVCDLVAVSVGAVVVGTSVGDMVGDSVSEAVSNL